MLARPWEQSLQNLAQMQQIALCNPYCLDYSKSSNSWPQEVELTPVSPPTEPVQAEKPRSIQVGGKRKQIDTDRKKSCEETRMPHRLIEKKRRDRINSSISSLKELLPSAMQTQTSRPLEKAVVLEMTIKYVKSLQRALHIKTELEYQDIPVDRYQEGYNAAVSKLRTHSEVDYNLLNFMEVDQKFSVKSEPNDSSSSNRTMSIDGEKTEDSLSHSSGYDSCDAKNHDETRSCESPPIDVVGTDSDDFPLQQSHLVIPPSYQPYSLL